MIFAPCFRRRQDSQPGKAGLELNNVIQPTGPPQRWNDKAAPGICKKKIVSILLPFGKTIRTV